MNLHPYIRLMRFDKPVGILLLWFPTAWALWLANQGKPAPWLIVYFLLGTIFMRAAGCVVNDLADRRIDKKVKRTQSRPLATGEVTFKEGVVVLGVLLFCAFLILIQLPLTCFYYALVALFVTILYPFCKRFFQAPQLVLGVAFSMGIPMAYSASGVTPDLSMGLLCIINFAWIVSYDTMYAMVDRDDDLNIGVKSTAILFGQFDRLVLGMLQFFFHSVWIVLAITQGYSALFYIAWGLAAGVLVKQQTLVHHRQREACFKAFIMNGWYGLLMWIGMMPAPHFFSLAST